MRHIRAHFLVIALRRAWSSEETVALVRLLLCASALHVYRETLGTIRADSTLPQAEVKRLATASPRHPVQ
jgi:hypothetical protein